MLVHSGDVTGVSRVGLGAMPGDSGQAASETAGRSGSSPPVHTHACTRTGPSLQEFFRDFLLTDKADFLLFSYEETVANFYI